MSDLVEIEFFSDTNTRGALDELELLQLDTLHAHTQGVSTIEKSEYASLQGPIDDIVQSWGGAIHL